jgi:hypothetical protein
MKLKRPAFIVILLLFVAFVAWRVLHVPYRPDVLLQAIPRSAVFVSEHDELASRWSELASNPLIESILTSVGVESDDLESFREDNVVDWLMNRFAARRTVIAYLPALGPTEEPAWVLASWGGLHARMLKWGVYSGALGDFAKQTFPGGRRGWLLEDTEQDFPGQHLSLAVADGALLAVLSAHPQGVNVPLERIERDAEILPGLKAGLRDRDGVESSMDRGWLALDGPHGDSWNYDIALNRPGLAEASFTGSADLLPAAGEINVQERLDELVGVLKDAPGALIVGPFSLLKSSLTDGDVRFVADLLAEHTSGGADSFITLCASGYSGRILGYKVATLMMGVRLKNRHESEAIIDGVLDNMNAEFGTTLIQRDVPMQGIRMKTIESVKKGPLSRLAREERPAYTMVGDWLFISSNRKALEKVRRKKPNKAGPWREELQSQPGHMVLWTDLESTGKSLSKVAAVYDLISLFQGQSSKNSPVRQNIALAQEWIDTLMPMKRICAWGSSTTNACTARIRIGVLETASKDG